MLLLLLLSHHKLIIDDFLEEVFVCVCVCVCWCVCVCVGVCGGGGGGGGLQPITSTLGIPYRLISFQNKEHRVFNQAARVQTRIS